RQELAMITDQAARRRRKGDPCLAAARGTHVGELPLALGHLVDDGAAMPVVDIDDDGFIRLLATLQSFAKQHPRAADRQLETLAPHRFDQHAELKLAATR